LPSIKQKPEFTCTFSDIKNQPAELQEYMKLSCRLAFMGLKPYGLPDTVFNPNNYITRAQFGTILARLIYHGKYNLERGDLTTPWYQLHLNALRKDGIMKQIENPTTRKELKSFVLLMLRRAADIINNQ
jgi:hypothetical protein